MHACNSFLHFFHILKTVPDKENVTTKWSEWTPCSKTCGDAKRKRIEYRCTSSSQQIRDCTVSGLQHDACAFKPCPGKCIVINGKAFKRPLLSNCTTFLIIDISEAFPQLFPLCRYPRLATSCIGGIKH